MAAKMYKNEGRTLQYFPVSGCGTAAPISIKAIELELIFLLQKWQFSKSKLSKHCSFSHLSRKCCSIYILRYIKQTENSSFCQNFLAKAKFLVTCRSRLKNSIFQFSGPFFRIFFSEFFYRFNS